jgi:alginate O-acetyltransferase complex protein AlgI
MRFDSAEFAFFFMAVLVAHRLLPWRRALLVVASYAFYASWNPPFLLLLLFSTGLDFAVSRAMEKAPTTRRRRALLGVSIAGNLGVLAYFKYVNFLLENLAAAGLAEPATLAHFHVATQIPLGISFYTFQTLGYSIDVYRGKIPACRSLGDFALFVTFFPQLIAGPVIRAHEFLPQILRNRRADLVRTLDGIELCLVGYFMKVVISDNFATVAESAYAEPAYFSGAALAVATGAFAVQLYCDFAGYSTIARGLAKLLGYELPVNFDYPLLAANPIEYRRGWHITMGNWFRDYLYRPLGGDRGGRLRTAANTMITWTAFGFWHGASWTFLAWGFYNGLLLVGYRLVREKGWLDRMTGLGWTIAGYVSMPVVIGSSYVFFRAASVEDAFLILGRVWTLAPGTYGFSTGWGLGLVALYAVHWASRLYYTEPVLSRVGWPARLALVGTAAASIALLAGDGQPFYYFQF